MKYTVEELIRILSNFPSDLKIETELALMWNYPDEIKEFMDSMSEEDFLEYTMNQATDLCIFEGSWEKNNISNIDGKYEKFAKYRNI